MDIQQLDKIGTLGLAVMVWGLMHLLNRIIKGDLVTRREHEGSLARESRLEERLERALNHADGAIHAGETIAAKK